MWGRASGPTNFKTMKKTHLTHIGQMIRLARESRELTVEAAADKIGIGKGDLSELENGKRNFTINTLVKICNALNCVIDIQITPR